MIICVFRQKEAEAAEEKPVSYMDHIGDSTDFSTYMDCYQLTWTVISLQGLLSTYMDHIGDPTDL